jgi:predicted outer membrane repeat protein
MTSARIYGCDLTNNSAGEDGGAVCLKADCSFQFYSDDETGKAGTIKNNSAGELGGGVYQGNRSGVTLGGEIYVSGNTSSKGNDDLYLKDTGYIYIYHITSPEGSIGLRLKSDEGDRLTTIDDKNKDVNPKVFFVNNEGFEVVRGEYRYSTLNDTMIPCLNVAKKSASVGSIFGGGSLTMIVSILALLASATAIGISISTSKKKASPAAEIGTAKAENEE